MPLRSKVVNDRSILYIEYLDKKNACYVYG